MGTTKDHDRGYWNGWFGGPPKLSSSIAEDQGYKEGRANYESRWGGSAGGSLYSPAVERVLAIIGSVLAAIGIAIGAVASYGTAGRMGLGLVGSLTCAGIGGLMGAGLGFVIPRVVLATLLLAWFVVLCCSR
jgi:hypothetical protein